MRYRNCIWILGECCCCKAAAQGRPTIPYVSLSRSPSLSLPLSLSPSLPPSLPPSLIPCQHQRQGRQTHQCCKQCQCLRLWLAHTCTDTQRPKDAQPQSIFKVNLKMRERKYACVYERMQACMYVCTHGRMHVCKNACTHARMYARMHLCMNACTHECVYARMHS